MLNDSYVYGHAWDILTYDSLLILVDIGQEDVIYLFNRNTGLFLKSTGKKGRGPGELVSPGSVTLDKRKGILYVNDNERKAIVQYCLKNIKNDSVSPLEEMKLSDGVPNLSRIYYLRDSLFIADEATEIIYASVYKDEEQVLAKIDLKDATEVQKE